MGTLDGIVFAEKPDNEKDYIPVVGRVENEVIRWINKEHISRPNGFDCWQVLIPNANGSKSLGSISNPMIIEPHSIYADIPIRRIL